MSVAEGRIYNNPTDFKNKGSGVIEALSALEDTLTMRFIRPFNCADALTQIRRRREISVSQLSRGADQSRRGQLHRPQ